MEFDRELCPVVKIDGAIDNGKQFDLDITLPKDNRNVIYGVIRDNCKDPICDAVVKLIETENKLGKDIRKPVSHTFTDEHGEFVFGPLCPDRLYEIQIWVNKVRHVKICTECHKEGSCLKGIDICCKPFGRKNDFGKPDFDKLDCDKLDCDKLDKPKKPKEN